MTMASARTDRSFAAHPARVSGASDPPMTRRITKACTCLAFRWRSMPVSGPQR